MKILALEFSSPQRSMAVVEAKRETAPLAVAEVVETGGLAARPLGMIEEVLRVAKLEREQIEVLAVGLGPGSYTGIRTAIALAQGWQLARGVKLMGISSAECIVAEAQAEGITGKVAVVIDAQRGEFYLAGYELSSTGWRVLEPLHLASAAEVKERARVGMQLLGPEVKDLFPESRSVFPLAGTLGRLAVGRDDFVAGETLEPIYLRQTSFVKAPRPITLPGAGPTTQ
jgi:tRNA threonylcarbamoyladenosine biosynthesis protein TsaB